MFKNWFLLASVSCGVGFGSTFLISRNLQQSTLAGLGTVPAVAASLTILSRQRREEIDRQLDKSKVGLDYVREQEQLAKDSCRKISAHGQELQARLEREINSLVLQKRTQESLLVRLDAKVVDKEVDLRGVGYQISQMEERRNQISITITDLDRQQQSLQQEISDLLLQKQDQRILLDRLVINISTKQNNLFKLDTEISERQANLDRTAIDLVDIEARKQSTINSAQRSELARTNSQREIHQDSAIKEQLNVEITELQNSERNLKAEIDSHEVTLAKAQQQISVLKEQQEQISISVNELNRSVKQQESLLDDLDLEICNRQQVKEDINSQIAELDQTIALFSGRENGELLSIGSADLYKKWQQVNQQVSQLEDGMARPSIAVESLDLLLEDEKFSSKPIETVSSITDEKWKYHFKDNPHLPVLKHIDEYDVVTESEAFIILGNNGTLVRQFANKFRQYNQHLPFSIRRVEILNSGSRYVKENTTIIDSQNPYIISPLINVEPELDISETERVIMIYKVCRFCGRTPSPCEDTCRACN